jgi:hypothetical protein
VRERVVGRDGGRSGGGGGGIYTGREGGRGAAIVSRVGLEGRSVGRVGTRNLVAILLLLLLLM